MRPAIPPRTGINEECFREMIHWITKAAFQIVVIPNIAKSGIPIDHQSAFIVQLDDPNYEKV